jgi:hypothetical protein
MEPSARLFFCLRCHTQVVICRRCDRGQRYCADGCATTARRISVQRARRRYQKTRIGRLSNAQRQQRFRDRLRVSKDASCEPIQHVETKVTHQGSAASRVAVPYRHDNRHAGSNDALLTPTTTVRCHWCNNTCSAFLRRDFLATSARSPP